MVLRSVEMCAGAGGQALGLEHAGFEHSALVEIERDFCATLKLNRPNWNVIQQDLNQFSGLPFGGVDLLAGGLPCPPFSVAGKQLGQNDERNLFPAALRIIHEMRPKAIMIENVRGFLDPVFGSYRSYLREELEKFGYQTDWRLLNASDFGVPQLRPRVVIIALRREFAPQFNWPEPHKQPPKSVGETLHDLMASKGWEGAKAWADHAKGIAPTVVGGSKKHGGPDLGPTRAKRAWATLGVDGIGIADAPPEQNHSGMPRLTVRMVARLQGFPDNWEFFGRKTTSYRQVGNAFPPPVATAVAINLAKALKVQKPLRKAS